MRRVFYKIVSLTLIILHLFTFGPIKDALAFSASSATYNLSAGTLNEGGRDRTTTSTQLWQDEIAEPVVGKTQSTGYVLFAGFIPTIQVNAPLQTQTIPNQTWQENTAKSNAFDLDDYFTSDVGALTYTVSGNSKISVTIDQSTHQVSFSQPAVWYGTEKVNFTATDTENNSTQSNEISLLVEGVDNPPVLDYIPDITVNETELVKIIPSATDLDGDAITYSFSSPLNSAGQWQTDYTSSGTYTITVTATDTTNLSDSQTLTLTVKNINRAPVLSPISDITANEGDLVTVIPQASDPDNDAISLYYSAPLDTQGKWLTNYNDAGTYTVTVTASDGIDTVSSTFKIIINNTNRAPQVTLSLSKYTVSPNEVITINLSVSEPDSDTMTFSLKKDGAELASGSISNTYTTTTSFSNIGDHTISATVTDASGLSTTVTKGVDCADPNANRDYINPVMGDFNGDALSDLGLHDSQTGKWEIALSEAGTFQNAVDWLTDFGTSKDWWPLGGDFNADGKSDIAIYNNTTGELKVALSSGAGFSVSGTWLTFSAASYTWQPFTGNFNADKYTDFCLYNKDTGEVKVALGTGSGFSSFNTWLTNFGTDYVALAGDFNGDSLTDLCLFKKSTGEFKVAFSNSKSFVDGSSWLSGFATNKDPLISDFNNDGLSDIGYWDNANFNWNYAISTGTTFINKGIWLTNFGTTTDESASTGDFDGNGVTDAATFDKDQIGIQRWTTQLSTNKPTDLLTEIDNGIGGKTQVIYTYAAKTDNSSLPFPVYVASAISLVNTFPSDRAATYTQNFTFSGGYYDSGESEFRGFAKVKVTDPITNNYTETYFFQGKPGQDGALKGQIEKLIAYDGNNRIISQTLNTYEVKTAGPAERFLGFPALIEQTTTVYEENATYITTKDKYSYDNIGNLLEEKSEGDTAKTGDERASSTTYAQAYEIGFNRPLETLLKAQAGNTVSKKAFEYDNKGNLNKEEVWLYNPLTQTENRIPTTYSYDSFGNLTSTTNSLGSVVTTDYETSFYTYPEKITNSLGHTIQYVYEPKFGVVKSVTDANGTSSSTTYDTLGRVISAKNGLNQITVTYTYPDFNTKITTNAIGLTGTEYIDGLGRKYKTVSSGEDGTSQRNVSSEVFYNSRGLTEKESLSHYIDEDPTQISYIRYENDIRGRIKKTISDFPGTAKDAESSVNYINPLYTETTDPQGHRKGTLKDVYGNIIEVIEFTQGGVFHTYYTYDTQNNLIKTTDTQGNLTQIFYDSLGRKIKMQDPDMGVWLYEYDLVGNLKQQTDAKAQVLTFTYDALNRLTEKKGLSPEGGLSLTVSYFYDDTTKPNSIGRLSKVTDSSGSTEFFYDKLGREVKSIKAINTSEVAEGLLGGGGGLSYTVQREYDILDRLTKLTYPDGEVVNYTYDTNSGLLEKVQGTSTYVQDLTYNATGQIKVIKYGNSTQTDYTYAQDLRLSQILTQDAGLKTLQNLNYLFDKNGNITTLTDNLRSNIRTFTYDDLDRLTQASNVPDPQGGYTTFTFQYDSIGNMTYKSDIGVMTYGLNAGPHSLSSAGGYTYKYDANGNMTQGKNKTLSYDVENRLLEVNELGIITTFQYDGDGGRVKKTTSSNSTLYIGSLFEKDSDGKTRKHIFAGANRAVTVIASPEGAKQSLYYHSDHLGSSNIITDASGQQLAYYEYTPYGTIARNEGTDAVKHKFTGKELDATGLYFYGARYYDPTIGRFITADTIVQAPYDPQSLNRYAYARNNPINYIDPTGHFFWVIVIAIVKAVAAFAAAHPVIFGAIVGATLNTAMNASNIHNFGNFMAYAAIGAAAGAAGGGLGAWIGASSPFWGTVAGGFAGGFVGGAGNAGYQGASFSQALAFGAQAGAIAAGTAAVLYGTVKIGEKVISSTENASNARAKAAGVKTPSGQRNESAVSLKSTNTIIERGIDGYSRTPFSQTARGQEIKNALITAYNENKIYVTNLDAFEAYGLHIRGSIWIDQSAIASSNGTFSTAGVLAHEGTHLVRFNLGETGGFLGEREAWNNAYLVDTQLGYKGYNPSDEKLKSMYGY